MFFCWITKNKLKWKTAKQMGQSYTSGNPEEWKYNLSSRTWHTYLENSSIFVSLLLQMPLIPGYVRKKQVGSFYDLFTLHIYKVFKHHVACNLCQKIPQQWNNFKPDIYHWLEKTVISSNNSNRILTKTELAVYDYKNWATVVKNTYSQILCKPTWILIFSFSNYFLKWFCHS